MADISVANAEFIGLWLQLVVVGAYLVYLPQCVLILKRRFWEGLSRYLAAACAVIFMIVSTNTVIAMIRAYQAFAPHGHGPPDPERYYENTSTPLCLIKNSLEIVMSIISDLIIVYRTFIVWDVNSLAFAFPICLLGLNIGLGTWSLRTMSQVKPGGPVSMLDVTEQCCYFMITTFSLNLFCGVMICWRIWNTNRDATQKKRFSALHGLARRVFETVLQTAAVHCVILFAIFLTGCLNTNVFFIFIDMLTPTQAFVFTVLIVRANVLSQHTPTASSSLIFYPVEPIRSYSQGASGTADIVISGTDHTGEDAV